MELEFTVPGAIVSGNHARKLAHGYLFKTNEAKEFKRRVQSIAKAAAIQADWKMPLYCRVDLECYNQRSDRDNISKELLDAMQGIVFPYDSRVLAGHIEKWKDDGDPRVVVRVEPVNPKDHGY